MNEINTKLGRGWAYKADIIQTCKKKTHFFITLSFVCLVLQKGFETKTFSNQVAFYKGNTGCG